jgi:pyridoxine 5-phosphate synthase
MALLGVNIDHVATVRNARGSIYPSPVQAALMAEAHGADGITVHLREDRRHILDADLHTLKSVIKTRLNLEMANTPEMLAIALQEHPHMVTLVPEKRQEVTTEGGLDVITHQASLTHTVQQLQAAGIGVSLFIDPDLPQLQAAATTGATIVEFHTGRYCDAYAPDSGSNAAPELQALMTAAQWCVDHHIQVNAGHGLNTDNVRPVLRMPGLVELNIGHSIIADAIFVGLGPAVARMKALVTG